ncbi:exodeoxyribonuclease VII large subunit [uncultured Phocaeicola sp.]|uniref:exodeoxyribonuclease VII large subunit n=1 Tax=uncultured Phocaeicola sp. TaxID=990718 RepID=UPI00260A956D|nr:exodeoxyribonuclease VII large subunit [uncultured Phocaeicola sp.]
MEEHSLSLYELNALVKRSINTCMPDTYWVQAELSDVRSNYSGHCYLEFVQKEPRGNNLIAKARGAIWSNVYRLLKPYFEEETGQAFVAGIKVMVKVSVEFHELYGYSLTVQDIDPTYTLGDMARRRREILKQLEEEGVLTLNKELEIPLLAQRIAVISSATAAGYGDFCNQLEHNPYGFVFYSRLFPAIMQGERVEQSVIAALDAINACRDHWDVVVIIRGGGATSDLSGFDTYELAANCAQFPLPIITGIGHERDDTVLDSVSHTRVKTPTAAAEFLINHLHDTAEVLENHASAILQAVSTRMEREKVRLARIAERIPVQTRMRLNEEHYRQERIMKQLEVGWQSRLAKETHFLNMLETQLGVVSQRRLVKEQHRLQLLEQEVKAASPEHLLKRGYSITLKNGKAVTDASALQPGDELITRLAQGEIKSIVTKK